MLWIKRNNIERIENNKENRRLGDKEMDFIIFNGIYLF